MCFGGWKPWPGAVRPAGAGLRGFTLLELLVTMAIIGLLAGILFAAVVRAQESARTAVCAGRMGQLASGTLLYVAEHGGTFPRSQHSAFANGELSWGRAIAPELGSTTSRWQELLQTVYRCPSDKKTGPWSYGLNVFFELGPDDDYAGKPRTWRALSQLERPAATILFAENASTADHIMPNFWVSEADAGNDVDGTRHSGKANYIFADGHVEKRSLASVYLPNAGIDCWNPLNAR